MVPLSYEVIAEKINAGLDNPGSIWYNGIGSTQGGRMAVTISDVARKAGVGVGTVSRVINNSPRVSEPTRRKVLEAMQDLDYVPNPFARRLSLGKALTLAIIAPFFTRPSSVERLRGVEAVIVGTEYDLIR